MNAWMDPGFSHNPRLAAVWLDTLLKSFVVLAFAGGLCLAWRRAAAATRHLIWFLSVAGLLLLPLLPFFVPATPRPLWTVSSGQLSGNEIALSLELGSTKPTSAVAESAPFEQPVIPVVRQEAKPLFNAHLTRDWVSFGLGAWAIGALLVLLYPIVGRIQLAILAKRASVLTAPEWAAHLDDASHGLGIRRRVRLLQSSGSVMPLTWGWLRPKVLLPLEADEWPEERRRVVLLHELAHVKRWDCLTQSLTRLACAIYCFNPLAWIAARQMRIERERACDDLVLNVGCRASDYAGHLVDIARTFRRAPQGAGIAMARSSNLEQRVTAIVDASRVRRLHPAGLVGIFISIATVLFYIGGYKTNAAVNDRTSSVSKQTLAQLEKFSAAKEAQAKMLAAAAGETIYPQFQKYFDAAKKGDFRTITNMYADFRKYHPQYAHEGDKDWRPAYRTSYWQPMLEISLVYDQFASSDAKFMQQAAHDLIDSIPPGSIYFGGTDPGRGLPTAFSKSQVDADPFYTLSQNPLTDPTYEEYLREMYGEKRSTFGKLAEARKADPELLKLDKQFQAARQKTLDLEMSKSGDDAERQTAEKALEDLRAKRNTALERVEKMAQVDAAVPKLANAGANSWSRDRVLFIPSTNDVQNAFLDYKEDVGRRKQHDDSFPQERKQVRRGEDIKMDNDGHVQIGGQVAVQAINARLTKLIFEKNPNRDFYVEESFPHDWMYPYLEPNGLIMKINRQPQAKIPDDVIQKDQDYWQARVDGWLGKWLTPETPVEVVADFATKVYGRKNLDGFAGDPDFVRDDYAPKMFSKWRSSIAGLYKSRLGIHFVEMPPEYVPKDDAEKRKLMQAADFALKQAFALCPYSPEVVFSYVDFLVKEGRKADAVEIAHSAVIIDPKNEAFRDLEKNLTQGSQRVQAEAEYNQQRALNEKLQSLSREDLRRALPIAYSDTMLNQLLSDLDNAKQELEKARSWYTPQNPDLQKAELRVRELQQKVDDRIDGVMLGLQARAAFSSSRLEEAKKETEKVNPPDTQIGNTEKRLRELDLLRLQKEAEYIKQKVAYEKLKALSREDLKKVLPINFPDTQMTELMKDLDAAQTELNDLSKLYTAQYPRVRTLDTTVKMLQKQIDERVDGIMMGAEARLNYSRAYIDTIKKDVEEARKTAENAR